MKRAGFDWNNPRARQGQLSHAWICALMVLCVDAFVGIATGSVLAVLVADAVLLVAFAAPGVIDANRAQGRDAANADENGRIRDAARTLERRAGR